MVRFVDTSLSGLASAGMRGVLGCRVVLPFLERMDAMGFHAIDILDPEVNRVALAAFGEDPYDRLARAARLCTGTPLNVVVAGRCLLGGVPAGDGAIDAEMRRLASCGARSLTCLDPLGDRANASVVLRAARAAGLKPVAGIAFAVSPQHTIAFFVEAAREALKAGAGQIRLADSAGLLNPDRARELVPALREAIGGMPLEIHTACRSGLAEKTCFDAVDLGADLIATATAPLAGGGMAPSAEHLAAALVRACRLQTPSLGDLSAMADYFDAVCEASGAAVAPHELPDPHADTHQLPAALLDELATEAAARGIADRMDRLYEEVAAVRSDLGAVSAVYDLGQAMVRQAVEHVASGRRYGRLEDLLVSTLSGELGRGPGAPDAVLLQRALGTSSLAPSPGRCVSEKQRDPPDGIGDPVDASTPLALLEAEIARRPWVQAIAVRTGTFEWAYEAGAGAKR